MISLQPLLHIQNKITFLSKNILNSWNSHVLDNQQINLWLLCSSPDNENASDLVILSLYQTGGMCEVQSANAFGCVQVCFCHLNSRWFKRVLLLTLIRDRCLLGGSMVSSEMCSCCPRRRICKSV